MRESVELAKKKQRSDVVEPAVMPVLSPNGFKDVRITPAMLRKRFRLDEFLAEKLITAIAMLSLAAIVMIFLFVFREAAPIFSKKEQRVYTTPVQQQKEETYGEEYLS
ncbi:MAG: hypothetical protein AAB209_11340, partial [Bacteroidota bacterium]